MVKNIKNVFKTSMVIIAGSFVLIGCESEADNLGSQFFDQTAAEGVNASYDVVAYNINNNDTLRTDAIKLTNATLGAFTEPQFGMQKSSLVTQIRLTSYDPDFGVNAVVDSAVLVFKPQFPADSATTTTMDDYKWPDGDVAAKKEVKTYPITKYGKGSLPLTLNVHEVDDFLGSGSDMVFSNKVVNYSTLIGTSELSGKITSVKITKDSDNSEILVRDPSLRIPLEPTFFQNKIIAKKGQPELLNASNFIRYFKGVRLSVAENDGYIMKFNPGDMQIVVYYKKDVTANGTTTREKANFTMSLGSGNAKFSQIEYDRTGAAVATVLANSNSTTGDAKIYTQGMGGPSFGIRIPAATVAQLKDLYKNDKIGIISAKIKLFTDASVWNNKYEKPKAFTVRQKNLNTFLAELDAFGTMGTFQFVRAFNLDKNPAYYEVGLTQTLKNIIEKEAENRDLILEVGDFEINAQTGQRIGVNYNSRAYTPNRVVLVGTDPANANRAQLNIIYSKK